MNSKKMEYARAYFRIQTYQNLLSLNDAFKAGTIFLDLYEPYGEKKKNS